MVHWLFTGRGGRFPFASTSPEGQMELYEWNTVTAHLHCDPGWNDPHQGCRWDNIKSTNKRESCIVWLLIRLFLIHTAKLQIIRELKELAKKVFLNPNENLINNRIVLSWLNVLLLHAVFSLCRVPHQKLFMTISIGRKLNTFLKKSFFFCQAAVDL